MYRPRAFGVDDVGMLHTAIRTRVFATVALAKDGIVNFAYVPTVLDSNGGPGKLRFHLALNNEMTPLVDGARLKFSFLGPDTYVSPDWYASEGMVPTWNYIAVEGEGRARRLSGEELRALLVDLSAAQEEKLLPKKPWTMDKVPKERLTALTNAIVGFSVTLEKLEGKFKLSQDKKSEDFAGVIAGLEASGDAASLAVAKAMRERRSSNE